MPLTPKSSVDKWVFAKFTARSFNSSTKNLPRWIPSFTLSSVLSLLLKPLKSLPSDRTEILRGCLLDPSTKPLELSTLPFRSMGELKFHIYLVSRADSLRKYLFYSLVTCSFFPIVVVFDSNQNDLAREDRVSSFFLFSFQLLLPPVIVLISSHSTRYLVRSYQP